MAVRANRSNTLIGLAVIGLAFLPRIVPAAESPRSPQQLFNGLNLAGWTTWLVDTKRQDPRRVFSVTNGAIHISGDGLGYLATTNEFRNYKLVVDFKWGVTNTPWGDRIGNARDSGIFLHAIGPQGNSYDGHGAFMAAIECNLFEGATGDFLLIRGTNANGAPVTPRVSFLSSSASDADGFHWFRPAGQRRALQRWGRVNWIHKSPHWRDAFGFRGQRDVEKLPGEWNHLAITCDGAHIRVEVNGMPVNEAFDVFPSEGKILLQCEGSEIFFSHVELQPLR